MKTSVRIGVPFVNLSYPSSTSVPSLSTLVFDASAVTPTLALLQDLNQPLSTSVTYQVAVGLLGVDSVNGGYTVSTVSPGSGIVSLSSNQGIRVHVANGAWPGNTLNNAICAVMFLKIGGNTNWTLSDFAYIDTSNDFNHLIQTRPLNAAPSWTLALLQSASSDPVLGSRSGVGITYNQIGPTTGGVTVTRDVSTVSVAPDNGPDYNVTTSTAANLTFNSLPNNVYNIVQAIRGTYGEYQDANSITIEEAQQTLLTAQALFSGNAAIKFNMPPDSQGFSETRLYLGNLEVTQAQVTEAWSKTATVPVVFNLQTASQDTLLTSQRSEIVYKRTA